MVFSHEKKAAFSLHERDKIVNEKIGLKSLKDITVLYENARMDGLCHEGAWECALTAVSSVAPESNAQLLTQLRNLLQNPLASVMVDKEIGQ